VEDPLPDLDGDYIPNWVEVAMGFDPQDPSDGRADDDGDGKSNGKEWLAGTDRLGRNPELEILSVVDLTGALDQFEVTWTSVSNPGVFYDLELSEDGHAWIPIEIDIPATATLTKRIVNRLSPSRRLFFRVGARRP